MIQKSIRILQPILLGIALIFVTLLLRQQWAELRALEWRLHGGWLLLSGVLLVSSWFVEVAMWRTVLAWVDGRIPYRAAVRIWFASILVRYVPGNVWQPLSMTALGRREGVRVESTVLSIVLYQAINLLAVVPLASLFLLGWGHGSPLRAWLGEASSWLALAMIVPLLIFLLRTTWFVRLINFALTMVGRPALSGSISSQQLLVLLLVAVGDWILWGGAFAALTFALHPFSLNEQWRALPHLFIAYPIAYAVGYLSFITPGGLAVREGALVLLLTPVIGSVATVAALAMRLWQVAWEAIVAGGVTLWLRGRALSNSVVETGD